MSALVLPTAFFLFSLLTSAVFSGLSGVPRIDERLDRLSVEHKSYCGRCLAPPDTMLIKSLGDSYQKLGRLDEAREAFERSLELDGEQPAVKARLAHYDSDSGAR